MSWKKQKKLALQRAAEVEEFLAWLDRFSEQNQVKFTITISADISLATEALKAYF